MQERAHACVCVYVCVSARGGRRLGDLIKKGALQEVKGSRIDLVSTQPTSASFMSNLD